MTTIFFTGGKLYTDTTHRIDGEEFHSLTKVQKLAKPLAVMWNPRKGIDTNEDTYPAAFEDKVHGYTVTGSNPQAEACIANIIRVASKDNEEGIADLDYAFSFYHGVVRAKLINEFNAFTIILIGEKAEYAFGVHFESVDLAVLARKQNHGFGTGGSIAVKEHARTRDPVRSMYAAYWIDKNSGGMTDIWTLPTVDHPVLERTAVCNARSKVELGKVLNRPIEEILEPDFVSNAYHIEMLSAWSIAGESIGYQRAIKGMPDPIKRSPNEKAAELLEGLVTSAAAAGIEQPTTPPTTNRKRTDRRKGVTK